jgi:hypothetical protein
LELVPSESSASLPFDKFLPFSLRAATHYHVLSNA